MAFSRHLVKWFTAVNIARKCNVICSRQRMCQHIFRRTYEQYWHWHTTDSIYINSIFCRKNDFQLHASRARAEFRLAYCCIGWLLVLLWPTTFVCTIRRQNGTIAIFLRIILIGKKFLEIKPITQLLCHFRSRDGRKLIMKYPICNIGIRYMNFNFAISLPLESHSLHFCLGNAFKCHCNSQINSNNHLFKTSRTLQNLAVKSRSNRQKKTMKIWIIFYSNSRQFLWFTSKNQRKFYENHDFISQYQYKNKLHSTSAVHLRGEKKWWCDFWVEWNTNYKWKSIPKFLQLFAPLSMEKNGVSLLFEIMLCVSSFYLPTTISTKCHTPADFKRIFLSSILFVRNEKKFSLSFSFNIIWNMKILVSFNVNRPQQRDEKNEITKIHSSEPTKKRFEVITKRNYVALFPYGLFDFHRILCGARVARYIPAFFSLF